MMDTPLFRRWGLALPLCHNWCRYRWERPYHHKTAVIEGRISTTRKFNEKVSIHRQPERLSLSGEIRRRKRCDRRLAIAAHHGTAQLGLWLMFPIPTQR